MKQALSLLTLLLVFRAVCASEEKKPDSKTPKQVPPTAVVEVTAPLPTEPLVTSTDPKAPRQPVPAHDGADYLKTIPGFAVIRKGGTDGDPVLRGMAGSRLVMLLDGEQILGGCGMRMDPPTAYIFPESYDRITLVKGPQTVLHGAGNSAGTVSFERTGQGFKEAGWRGSASIMGGSFGRHDEVVDAQVGAPAFYVRGIGTRSHSDDYEDGRGQRIHARYTRWSANAAFGWTPNENTRVEFSGARSDGEAAYADRMMDGSTFRRENIGLKVDARRLSSLVERLEFQVYRNYVDHVMDNYRLRTFVPSMMSPQPSVNNPDRNTHGGRLVATLRLAPTTQWIFGVDGQQNAHTLRSTASQFSTPVENLVRVDDARFHQSGIFTEFTHHFAERNRVISGLRVDRWHAEDRRARVAVSMMANLPNPTQGEEIDKTLTSGFVRLERELASLPATAYLGLGHAERFPDYWELINKESLASVSAFGTHPEQTTQLDLGLVKQAGTVKVSISAFASSVKDFILIQSNVSKPSGMGTRMATLSRNIEARTWGGEIGAEAALSQVFKTELSLAYTRGENRSDGLPLAQIPPFEARVGFAYDNRTWSTGLLFRGVAAQERFALSQGNIVGQDLGRTSGFGLLSLHGGWRPTEALLLSVGVDNLFNRTYAEHISRNASVIPGYTLQSLRVNEPGRMMWAKASLRFR